MMVYVHTKFEKNASVILPIVLFYGMEEKR